MKELTLKVKKIPQLGIDAEAISPDMMAGKSLEEIKNLKIYEGKKKWKLGDCFTIEGTAAKNKEEMKIKIKGDMSRAKRVGEGMSAGEIEIEGNSGIYLGHQMKGGKIKVKGNAASWTGMDLTGGKIEIKGDAGNFTGGTYRGKWTGMEGGEIIVHGNAGDNVGTNMTGGKISIKGNAGQFLGIGMSGGQIEVRGDADARTGAEMTGGEIKVKGKINVMMPSFIKKGMKGEYLEYEGDKAEEGEGKLYVGGQT